MEQAPAQFDIHPVGGVAQRIGAQELQDGLEQAQRHHADDQHDQRRKAFVNQHLVDDELEEDRRRQSEQLHKQRRHQHMGERAPVAHNRGPEPAESKGVGIDARPRRSRRVISTSSPEDSAAMSSVDSSCAVRAIGSTSLAIPLAEPAPRTAKPPSFRAQDRRIGNGAETLRGHLAKDARLQLKNVRAANDILSLRAAAGQGKLMPQLRGVAGDAVISRHQRKPTQPRIQ